MSLRWTPEQLAEYQVRHGQNVTKSAHVASGAIHASDPSETVEDLSEATLQEKIEWYCWEHGYYYFHDRSRGANRPGHPDLIIAMRNGRVLWLELKSRSGRMTREQKLVRLKLLACGHEFYEIRSYRGFLRIVGKASQCVTV